MRPSPITFILTLGALTSPAFAWISNPFIKARAESTWKPAQETGILNVAEFDQIALVGSSPKPTEAPARYGRLPAINLDQRALTSNTCGYVSNGLRSFTCISADATCAFADGYMGCCEPDKECNVIRTTCLDYEAVQAGSCDLPSDFQTICCKQSSAPSCFSWVLSTGSAPEDTHTFLECSVDGGSGILLENDPNARTTSSDSSTSSESSTSDETSTGTAASATTSEASDGGGGSSSNVGAIAGGVVGGVAAIAIIGLLAFFLLRRKKKNSAATTPDATTAAGAAAGGNNQQPSPMVQHAQNPQNPHHSFVPSSPSAATYPSGVPSNYGYQQPYDPNMAAAYGQQQAYSPGNEGYSPYPMQQQQQQGAFDQQAQYPSQYGTPLGYQSPSPGSPPPNFNTSPAPKENEGGIVGQSHSQPQQHPQNHQAQELPAVNPLGNEHNRAELS